MQLELRLWPRDCLVAAIDDYLTTQCDGVADGTIDDYRIRAGWLLKTLGPRTPLRSITFDTLEAMARKHGPAGSGLLYATIGQRIKFLRWCMQLAAKRKLIAKDDVPERPKLPKDVVRKKPVPGLAEYREMRMALAPGRFRWLADLFYWTGHHNHDAWSFEWWMLEPEYVWADDSGAELAKGRYWRRNHKNRRCEPCWFPMESEFRDCVLELFDANPARIPNRLITGRVWNLKRTFDAASDRAGLPRYTPIRFRAGFARMIIARRGREYARLAMGHEGVDSQIQGGRSARPAILERHYLGASSELFMAALRPMEPRA